MVTEIELFIIFINRLRSMQSLKYCTSYMIYITTFSRNDCLQLTNEGFWKSHSRLPHAIAANQGLLFPAAASDGNFRFYIAGGRSFNHERRGWDYIGEVWMYHSKYDKWEQLPSLPKAMASGCMVYINGDLIYIGGAVSKYRYADDPSKVLVLQSKSKLSNNETWRWRDDLIPALSGPRMYHGCVATNIDGEAGILVAGGYHAGRLSLFFRLGHKYLTSGSLKLEQGEKMANHRMVTRS